MRLNHPTRQNKIKNNNNDDDKKTSTDPESHKVGHDFRTKETNNALTTVPITLDMSILGVMMGITIDGMMGHFAGKLHIMKSCRDLE
jgi:ABC-type microcin C transport system permease subunit YejE